MLAQILLHFCFQLSCDYYFFLRITIYVLGLRYFIHLFPYFVIAEVYSIPFLLNLLQVLSAL